MASHQRVSPLSVLIWTVKVSQFKMNIEKCFFKSEEVTR